MARHRTGAYGVIDAAEAELRRQANEAGLKYVGPVSIDGTIEIEGQIDVAALALAVEAAMLGLYRRK